MDVQAARSCMAPAAPQDPPAHPAARLGHSILHLPSSLPLPRPRRLAHGKSEHRDRGALPVMLGGGQDEKTVIPPPPGSSQPLPLGGRLNQWNQLVVVLAGLCWLAESTMASAALGPCCSQSMSISFLLLLQVVSSISSLLALVTKLTLFDACPAKKTQKVIFFPKTYIL